MTRRSIGTGSGRPKPDGPPEASATGRGRSGAAKGLRSPLPAALDAELLALGLARPAGADGFTPPAQVIAAAANGLEMRARFNRGGTEVGLARARLLVSGQPLGPAQMRKAAGWFARFAYLARTRGWGDAAAPSTGWIAWQLWGGDAGRDWVEAERPDWQGR